MTESEPEETPVEQVDAEPAPLELEQPEFDLIEKGRNPADLETPEDGLGGLESK